MAENAVHQPYLKYPVKAIMGVIRLERNEITSIYFYAVLNGLIQLSLPVGIQAIISFILGGRLSASLVILISVVVLGVLLTGLTHVNQMRLIEKIQQKIFVRYAFDYSERITHINAEKTKNKYIPELLNRFFDVALLQKGISKLLLDIPAASIQIIFGLLLLSFYHYFFIFFGLMLVLIIYLILKYTGIKGMQYSIAESNYKYKVGGWLQEMARNLQTVQFSKNPDSFHSKTDEYTGGYLEQRTLHFRVLLKQYWTLIIFKVVITAAMLIVGSYLLLHQQLNIGQFIAAEIVILLVINSVEKLIMNLDNAYDVLTAVDKLEKLKNLPLEKSSSGLSPDFTNPVSIEVKNVSWSHQDHQTVSLLHQINCDIKSGTKVCLMGASDSGKKELLHLLAGYHHDFSGSITVNQLPFKDINLRDYRKHVGVYFQLHDIFEGTVYDNLTMGDQTIPTDAITAICRAIGLDQIISQMPNGYATWLHAKGKTFKRSVRMKIMICRELLKRPKLLLLEEPFDAVDADEKKLIHDTIAQYAKDTTVVIVTNDKDFASSCDQVVLMHQGSIVFSGSWSDAKAKIK